MKNNKYLVDKLKKIYIKMILHQLLVPKVLQIKKVLILKYHANFFVNKDKDSRKHLKKTKKFKS
jgi:hypothetical protein